MRRTIRVLIEAPETDEIVRPEELDLFARFLHLNILCRQWVNSKYLIRIELVRRKRRGTHDVLSRASSSPRLWAIGRRATRYVPLGLGQRGF
jgi:hypothetical protein